jgi:hypothetical protein
MRTHWSLLKDGITDLSLTAEKPNECRLFLFPTACALYCRAPKNPTGYAREGATLPNPRVAARTKPAMRLAGIVFSTAGQCKEILSAIALECGRHESIGNIWGPGVNLSPEGCQPLAGRLMVEGDFPVGFDQRLGKPVTKAQLGRATAPVARPLAAALPLLAPPSPSANPQPL